MITTRVLPPLEWDRPEVAELMTLHPFVADTDMQIIVVEDEGKIVGRWAVLRLVHLEGVWIDEAYRRKPSAVKSLLQATIAAARRWTDRLVMTGSADPLTHRLVTKHLNGKSIPIEQFWVPISGDQSCRYLH